MRCLTTITPFCESQSCASLTSLRKIILKINNLLPTSDLTWYTRLRRRKHSTDMDVLQFVHCSSFSSAPRPVCLLLFSCFLYKSETFESHSSWVSHQTLYTITFCQDHADDIPTKLMDVATSNSTKNSIKRQLDDFNSALFLLPKCWTRL